MIEIIVIIAVVKAFIKQAEEKNLNKVLWGIIGAASYYIPVLLISLVIFPYLVISGMIPATDETTLTIMIVVANIIGGVICCSIAYQLLKSKKVYLDETDVNILDHNID